MHVRSICAIAFCTMALNVHAADPITVDLTKFTYKGDLPNLFGYNDEESKLFLFAPGEMEGKVTLPSDGDYSIIIEASCDEAQDEKAKFKLTIGSVVVAKEHALTETGVKTYTLDAASLKKGEAKVVIAFTNDAFAENEYDRNLYIHSLKIEKKK